VGNAQLNLTTLFVGGGIFAATLIGTASAQTFRVTDDWVTLRPPGGGFHILMPPDWRQDPPRAQTRSSVSLPNSLLLRGDLESLIAAS
jgi:hypothetical protein